MPLLIRYLRTDLMMLAPCWCDLWCGDTFPGKFRTLNSSINKVSEYSVIDPQIISDFAKRLQAIIPESAKDVKDDIDKNIRAMVSSLLEKLDMVTRKELDVQKEVLTRTRAKVEALEKQLANIEATLEK